MRRRRGSNGGPALGQGDPKLGIVFDHADTFSRKFVLPFRLMTALFVVKALPLKAGHGFTEEPVTFGGCFVFAPSQAEALGLELLTQLFADLATFGIEAESRFDPNARPLDFELFVDAGGLTGDAQRRFGPITFALLGKHTARDGALGSEVFGNFASVLLAETRHGFTRVLVFGVLMIAD